MPLVDKAVPASAKRNAKVPRKTAGSALGIRDLVSYRLQKATYFATKGAYLFYAHKYEITPVEWRLLGNIYTDGPMSLVRLAEEVDIQLAQASRTITSLVKRGLVYGEADEKDGRSVRLSLTTQGKALYRKLLAEAVRYHQRLTESLTANELEVLILALEKLADTGRLLLQEERDHG